MIDRERLMRLLNERVDQHQSGDIGDLADEIVKLADSCSRNIPRGLWRNSLGAEMQVLGYVGKYTGIGVGNLSTLGGDISYAESPDELFGPAPYLVTEDSLRSCGYELIEPAEDES